MGDVQGECDGVCWVERGLRWADAELSSDGWAPLSGRRPERGRRVGVSAPLLKVRRNEDEREMEGWVGVAEPWLGKGGTGWPVGATSSL